MKKLMILTIALLMAFTLIACEDGGVSLPVNNDPTNTPGGGNNAVNTPDSQGGSDTQQPKDSEAGDIEARIAGFWRLDYPNIYNAGIMILFEDGRWESPGHLPTDHVSCGSFVIANEEAGIYQLRFTVERSTSPYAEIGHEFDGYYYDAQNDLLHTVLGSGEGNRNVGFIREHDVALINQDLFEAGFELLKHDSFGGLHYSMPYVDIIEYMGPPDREHEPEYWDADGLYHWSVYYEMYGYMQISFVNDTNQKEGGRVYSILTATYHSETTVRGIRLGSTRDEVLNAYADIINAEDSRGNRIVAGSVYGGIMFFMDHEDKVEWIFVGASTEYAMLQN